MEDVAQLVRAPDCGSGGRGFEPHLSPQKLREWSFLFLAGNISLGFLLDWSRVLFFGLEIVQSMAINVKWHYSL